MRILILGAGAVGGYFGGRLVQAGADVTFLVRPPRRDALAARGLVVESPACGSFTVPVRAITQADLAAEPRFDIVLLTCKAYDLDTAIEAIAPAMAKGAAVLPLLNGLSHLDRLNAAFGPANVLGGLAKIGATLAPDGTIRHLNDWRALTFGEQDGAMSQRVLALQSAFPADAVIAKAVPDILRAMWEKLVHLATVASMTCLMRANVGEIVRSPGGSALLIRTLETNAAIGGAAGFAPTEAFLGEYRTLFADPTSAYSASMLRDLERGGRVEADHIVGFMCERARAAGIAAPTLDIAYTHLKAYEARRAAGRI